MASKSKYAYEISTDKEPTKFIIYKATSPTNRVYVGQTTMLLITRISGHYSDARKYTQRIFPRTLNKYGNDVKWEIVDYANDWDELQELEKYWINELHSYYYDNKEYGMNLQYGGKSHKGQVMSEERKKDASLKTSAYQNNPENRIKIAESHGCKPFNVYDKDKKFIGQWKIQVDCAKELVIPVGGINTCLNNKSRSEIINRNHKTHKGYIFIYDDEEQNLDVKLEIAYKNKIKFNVYKKDTLEYIGTWEKQRQAAIDLNIDYKFISECLRGKCKSCKGYLFYFVDKDPYISEIEEDDIILYHRHYNTV